MANRSGWCRAVAWLVWLVPVTQASAAAYDFDYRLSGDRRVAPVQVFDDGRTTWLQFQPGQALPAIFEHGENGEALIAFTQQGPYMVLDGTATVLSLRIGDISARAEYVGQAARRGMAGNEPPVSPQWQVQTRPVAATPSLIETSAPSRSPGAAAFPVARSGEPAAGVALSTAARAMPAQAVGQDAAAGLSADPAPSPMVAATPAALEYDAGIADQNMRRVLERWSREAGWTFGPEHWTVDVDIPLIGSASFGADFRNAVRGLLASTELADRPLQPCFYANRVLRVVPLAQACDRTSAPAGTRAGRS